MVDKSSAQVLYVGNDQLIELRGLKDGATGEPLDEATVSCTLLESDGVEVEGEDWPLSMGAIAPGVYRATLAYTLPLVAGARYLIRIDVNAGAGLRGRWDVPCVCRLRA